MGKDREGKFHPRKGKPSASMKAENVGLKPIDSRTQAAHDEIADKYTVGDEEPAPHLHLRHRNRNLDKREERQTSKTDQKKATGNKQSVLVEQPVQKISEELPSVLTKEEFATLASFQSDTCISVFMQTHPAGAEVNEHVDNTAFKTMLRQVGAKLKQKGFDSDAIEVLLKPGYNLLSNDKFWRNLSHGLAAFMANGFFKLLRMPLAPKDELVINSTFHLTPLLPMITQNDYFYLLVLSKKQARLYRADAFGMVYIPVSEVPRGVDDVVHFEEKDDQKLFRTGSSGAGGGANYHGIGSGKPDDKENIAMYFDEVDESLFKAVLHAEHVPLLLAGVDYLIPIYKQVAKYKPIWRDAITGNKDYEDLNSLYQEARKKMEPYFEERHNKALEAYANSSGTHLTSSSPEDVIPAAYYKRVWHLFVQHDQHIWGSFDEMNNRLIIHASQEDGDENLIDKAILKTVMNAGEVHLLPKDRMPSQSPIAALMRYEITNNNKKAVQ